MRIYAEILAGGKGERMSSGNVPKQFLELNNKPVIIYTIEKFLECDNIDLIVIVIKATWKKVLNELIEKYNIDKSRISIVDGGASRVDSVQNGINFINEQFGINDDDIIVTHDAVRPFVTKDIINKNIECAKKYGAADTVILATDTIVNSINSEYITQIPERKHMYQGQTPQSFNIKLLLECFEMLTDYEKNIVTDVAKIAVLKNKKVMLVEGSVYNIKLTVPFDIMVAEMLIEKGE